MKIVKAFRKSPGKLSFPVQSFLIPIAVACAFVTSNVQATFSSEDFWQSQGFSDAFSYSNDADIDKLEALLQQGDFPILADFSIFNSEWYSSDFVFFDWNTKAQRKLTFAYDQPSELWPLSQGNSMFHWGSDFKVIRDLDLRMKAEHNDSQLFNIVDGKFLIDSSVTGTLFSDASNTSVFKISNVQGAQLLVSEGKELLLNGFFTDGGTGIKAEGNAEINNSGSLKINVFSGTHSAEGIYLTGTSSLHNQTSGLIFVNADTGVLTGSHFQGSLTNEGQFVIEANSLGMALSGQATVNNSGTLWIQSGSTGIDIGGQSVVHSSGIIRSNGR